MGGHVGRGPLPAAAVEVIHRVVNDSGRLTQQWAEVQIDELGEGPYAEVVGVTAIVDGAGRLRAGDRRSSPSSCCRPWTDRHRPNVPTASATSARGSR